MCVWESPKGQIERRSSSGSELSSRLPLCCFLAIMSGFHGTRTCNSTLSSASQGDVMSLQTLSPTRMRLYKEADYCQSVSEGRQTVKAMEPELPEVDIEVAVAFTASLKAETRCGPCDV
ncbi:hypothetical protein M3J09_001667 [Ascochyta lentis]